MTDDHVFLGVVAGAVALLTFALDLAVPGKPKQPEPYRPPWRGR